MPLPALARALLMGKPYFGPALRAMQGVPERHQYFLPVVRAVAGGRPGKELNVLEIGSWAGASTVSWAVALREAGCGGNITCVDPWTPYFNLEKDDTGHYREMNDAARDDLIVQLFQHNIRTAGCADMIEVHRGESETVLPGFGSGRFDIVYIDGSHRFDDVCFDIREAKRLLRGNGMICGDDLELQATEIDRAELEEAVSGRQDYVVPVGSGSGYHPGVTAAVAAEFSSVGVWEGFWAVTRSNDEWIPASLDVSQLRLPDHIAERAGVCKVVESTPTHNVVEVDGQFFAVAKSLGPVELFLERLGDRELPPVLLQASSLDEVRTKTAERSSSLALAANTGPALIGSYRGFNLVACRGRIYAARQALGPVDLGGEEREMEVRFGTENFVAAASVDLAKLHVDAIEAKHEISELTDTLKSIRTMAESECNARNREFAELRAAVESEIEAKGGNAAGWRTAVEQQAEQQKQEVAALRAALEEHTAKWNTDIDLLRSELESQLALRGAEIRMEAESRVQESAGFQRMLEQILQTQHGDQDRLRHDIARLDAGLRTELEMLKGELHAVSREHATLEHEYRLMRYGPGDRNSPCVAGEHRGFTLVYYRGCVYGLHPPMSPQELSHREYDLLVKYGPDKFIIGESLDGVRARIDLLENLRDMRAELRSFDERLRMGVVNLDHALQGVDEAIKAQDRKFEELIRSWPHRLAKLLSH